MRLLKNLVVSLLILLGVATIIFWGLARSLNSELIKDYIGAKLTTLTHQHSEVSGDISWRLFPRPAIKIVGVKIGQVGEQTHYAVKLDNLLFNLKITPLLRGNLVFSELNINGFQVDINADERDNFVENKRAKNIDSVAIPLNVRNIAEQFAIERVLLTHGQINIQQKQHIVSFADLQVGAEQFNLNNISFPLQFKTQLSAVVGDKNVAAAQINFTGSATLTAALFNDPLGTLQQMPINGQLTVQDLKFRGAKINTLQANVKIKANKLLLNPLTLNLYGGESIGDLSYDFMTRQLIFNQTATNLNGNKLSKVLLAKPWLKGMIDFAMHSQTILQPNWLETAAVHGSLTIKDGTISAVNLHQLIDAMSSKIHELLEVGKNKKDLLKILQLPQSVNTQVEEGSTAFTFLTLRYALNDAKLHSDTVVLQTERLQLTGDATLNLSDNSLDGHLYAQIKQLNPEVERIQHLLGGSFPMLVTGNLAAPKILPNVQGIKST